jgi:radical SAM protein with 4Fe4S-binding SPASM domain
MIVARKGDVFTLKSERHNYAFNVKSGMFVRWGRTPQENPEHGWPELADIEITTKCANGCPFCYKGNTADGRNMTLDTFKKLFHKLPVSIRQIAFGVDAHGTSNPDMLAIMDYCRDNTHNYVVPNVTVADITDEMAGELVKRCGAVAVSRYADKNKCYDTVKRLSDRGLKQTNIHVMLSKETAQWVMELFQDVKTDERLKGLNAIVMLSLKQRGRGEGYHRVDFDYYEYLVKYALTHDIRIGFDSCTAPKFLKAVRGSPNYSSFEMMTEPCESGLFSTYINTDGLFFPCSFSEGVGEWKEGLNILECENFMKDIWGHPRVEAWRKELTENKDENGCRNCPLFEV